MSTKIDLIKILSSSSKPITAADLSNNLNISKQSVKNYIKYINDIENIIVSTKNGFYINNLIKVPSIISALLDADSFNNQKNRIILLIEKVLTSSQPLNYYSFSQKNFISDSTFNSDFSKVNNYLKKFNCKLLRKKGYIYFDGNELQRRKIIKSLFRISSYTTSWLLKSICEQSGLDLSFIKKQSEILLKSLNTNSSDYALNNFVQHIVILLSRNKNSERHLDSNSNEHIKQSLIKKNNFEKNLEKKFKIKLSAEDSAQIKKLLSVIFPLTFKNYYSQDISKGLQEEVTHFTFTLIKEIKKTYYVDLFNDEFKKYFDNHLVDTIIRAKNNTVLCNPLTPSIYIKNPLIYDIAVFIAMKVNDKFDVTLPQDEITYLALHVGGAISLEPDAPKVKAFLKTASYHTNGQKQIEQINAVFSNQLFLIGSGSEVPKNIENIDLVINSSIASNFNLQIPQIKISPLINNADINRISVFVTKLQRQKIIRKRKKYFNSFFSEKYFEHNHYEKSPNDMINYMVKKAENLNLVDESFLISVLEREKITCTSFDNKIAIPHTITTKSNKSFAYVISNEEAMKWGSFNVNVIILIGIKQNDTKKFREIYNSLLNIFVNEETISKIITSTHYSEFLNALIFA